MAFHRHTTQQYLEQENNERIDELLQQTRSLRSLAGEIKVEIEGSIDDIEKVVRRRIRLMVPRWCSFAMNLIQCFCCLLYTSPSPRDRG